MRTLLTVSWIGVVAFLFTSSRGLTEEVVILDDFEDGDLFNCEPTCWVSECGQGFGRGIFNTADGDLQMQNVTPRVPAIAVIDGIFGGDVSVRTQVTFVGRAGLGVLAHGNRDTCGFYLGILQSTGFIGIEIFDSRGATFLRTGSVVNYDPAVDHLLQLDVLTDDRGQRLELRVWQCDDPIPETPNLEVRDATYRSGYVGLDFCNNCLIGDGTGQASFDFFWVAGNRLGGEPAPLSERRFRRGDANGDETLDVSDGIFTLNHLFHGGSKVLCLDAADSDDSGELDVTDALRVFNFLFLGGAELPPPFPDCGLDPTEDPLSCEAVTGCQAAEEAPRCE